MFGSNNTNMTTDEIKVKFENFLKSNPNFDLILRKNRSLVAENFASANYWFEYKHDDIKYLGEPIIDDTTNSKGEFYHIYITDFRFTGYLCYSDASHTDTKTPIVINATLRLCKQPDRDIDNFSYFSNLIEVWDYNQKLLNLSYFKAAKKLIGLDFLPYDYGMYSQTQSKIDNSLTNHDKQSHVTSHYYLLEIAESYERIKHLLSMVLMSADYANQYTLKKRDAPPVYNSPAMYEINENFHLYDRYYLLYSELTIESLYKYWERIGFCLFQFLKPLPIKKVNFLFLNTEKKTIN